MHSLFVRIFVLFWIAMAIIVGGSIAITFTVAAHEYESRESQRRPAIGHRLRSPAATSGRAGSHSKSPAAGTPSSGSTPRYQSTACV